MSVYRHDRLDIDSNTECEKQCNIKLFEVFYFKNILGSMFFIRILAITGIIGELLILFKWTFC